MAPTLQALTSRRLVLVIALTVIYIAIFLIFHTVTGGPIAMLVAVPTAVAAWCFGLRAGLVATGLAAMLNLLLVGLIDSVELQSVTFQAGLIVGGFVLVFFVYALGTFHDLSERLRQELARRKLVERDEQQRSAELEAVHNASLQLTSSLELKPVLSIIVQQAIRLLNAQEIHIFLYDGENLSFGAAFWEGQAAGNRAARASSRRIHFDSRARRRAHRGARHHPKPDFLK